MAYGFSRLDYRDETVEFIYIFFKTDVLYVPYCMYPCIYVCVGLVGVE